MRKIEVIFSQADKELVEKLRRRYKKLADRCLALGVIFKIIAGIALGGMIYFLTVNKSSYTIVAVCITSIFAIILFLISFAFDVEHDDYFASILHYRFMFEHMQEISEFEDSLIFSVSKTCPNAVIYNLPDGRYRCIETVNDIPADSNVIITVKEDVDAKNRISLDWYAKTV